MNMKMTVKSSIGKGLQEFTSNYQKRNPEIMAKVGVQLLNYTLNGSPRVSVVPPILDGILRSSGSVFVGGKLVGTSPMVGKGTPNTSLSESNPNVITVGFNTGYAARMENDNWTPGPVSQQSGDVGNKFLKQHIDGDMEALSKLYSILAQKELFSGGKE
jgi:hypothetical protein